METSSLHYQVLKKKSVSYLVVSITDLPTKIFDMLLNQAVDYNLIYEYLVYE